MRMGGVIRDKPHAPNLEGFQILFSSSFIDFYSCEIVSSSDTRKNEA